MLLLLMVMTLLLQAAVVVAPPKQSVCQAVNSCCCAPKACTCASHHLPLADGEQLLGVGCNDVQQKLVKFVFAKELVAAPDIVLGPTADFIEPNPEAQFWPKMPAITALLRPPKSLLS